MIENPKSREGVEWATILDTVLEDKHGSGWSIGRMTDRVVCHFSCGAASAVATKIMLLAYPPEQVVIQNAFVQEEHEDNRRFLADCEQWFNHPITVLREVKHGASTKEVWKKRRYMKGLKGAPCSKTLKADMLDKFRQPGDVTVLGYTSEESKRLERFFDPKSDHLPFAPLVELGFSKQDCFQIIQAAGIRLPAMYALGYNNANCIGCVKGGMGYWNKIRRDFPAEFNEIADIQEQIGPGANFLYHRSGPLKGKRFALRELLPTQGRYEEEPPISCGGFACEAPEGSV